MSRKPSGPGGHFKLARKAQDAIQEIYREGLRNLVDALATAVFKELLDALHAVYNEGLLHGRGSCRSIAAAYVRALRRRVVLPIPSADEVVAELGADDAGVARSEVLEICGRVGLPLIETEADESDDGP